MNTVEEVTPIRPPPSFLLGPLAPGLVPFPKRNEFFVRYFFS